MTVICLEMLGFDSIMCTEDCLFFKFCTIENENENENNENNENNKEVKIWE